MSDLFPVIAGLAVGIAFVILLAVTLKPDFMLSDDELVAKYSELAEVKYFLEKHPDAKAEVSRNPNERDPQVRFLVERQIYPSGELYTGIHSLSVIIHYQSYNPSLYISCHVAGSLGGMSSLESLEGIDSIDATEQMCFQAATTSERNNSNVAIFFVKSRGFGDCFFNCTHTHSIFIYDNGTGIHKEGSAYYLFQAPQQSVGGIIDQVYSLERKPEISNETDPDVTVIDFYCNDFFIESSVSLIVKGRTEKTLCYPGVPELRELEEKIEQIRQEYDDGIVDCTPDKRNCPVYIPRDLVPESTGLFEIEPETEVGEPIPVEVFTANATSIEITYEED